MKVLKDSLWCLASEGRLTLQVPQLSIGPDELDEVPDDWIYEAEHVDSAPVIGNKQGYWYLSKIGYLANRETILNVFAKAHEKTPADWGFGEESYTDLGGKKFKDIREKYCDPPIMVRGQKLYRPKDFRVLFDMWAMRVFELREIARKKLIAKLEAQLAGLKVLK